MLMERERPLRLLVYFQIASLVQRKLKLWVVVAKEQSVLPAGWDYPPLGTACCAFGPFVSYWRKTSPCVAYRFTFTTENYSVHAFIPTYCARRRLGLNTHGHAWTCPDNFKTIQTRYDRYYNQQMEIQYLLMYAHEHSRSSSASFEISVAFRVPARGGIIDCTPLHSIIWASP